MPDEAKPTSEWARKRAAGKILREALIKRREAYFDLLVSGYSIEEIASRVKKESVGGSSRGRSVLGEAAARRARGLRPPSGCAAKQGAALCRCFAGERRPEGDCAVRASRAGVEPLPRRQCRPCESCACGAAGNRADGEAACAHPFARHGGGRGRKKLRKGGVKSMKSFTRVNLCAMAFIGCLVASPLLGFANAMPLTQPARRHRSSRRGGAEIERSYAESIDGHSLSASDRPRRRCPRDRRSERAPNYRQDLRSKSLSMSSVSTRAKSSVKRRSRPLIQIPTGP
jgi:hypothetical protein